MKIGKNEDQGKIENWKGLKNHEKIGNLKSKKEFETWKKLNLRGKLKIEKNENWGKNEKLGFF